MKKLKKNSGVIEYYNTFSDTWYQESLINEEGREIGDFNFNRWAITIIPKLAIISYSHLSKEGKLKYRCINIQIGWLFWHFDIRLIKNLK